MVFELQLIHNNLKVKSFKEKLIEQFFDLINSWESNTTESNSRWFNGMIEEFKELDKLVKQVYESNNVRQILNLRELENKRNKLNRQIASLKKATLNN